MASLAPYSGLSSGPHEKGEVPNSKEKPKLAGFCPTNVVRKPKSRLAKPKFSGSGTHVSEAAPKAGGPGTARKDQDCLLKKEPGGHGLAMSWGRNAATRR